MPRPPFPDTPETAFVSRHPGKRITERLDAVYGDTASSSALDETLETLQSLSLPADDEWQ